MPVCLAISVAPTPSPYKVIIEVGRSNKTLYLLNYIDNEDYRRRILTQLNRVKEGTLSLGSFVTASAVKSVNATGKAKRIN